MEISLGKCHYGEFDEAATAAAVSKDGTGWIPVCDEHREQAKKDGYEPGDPIENLADAGDAYPDEDRPQREERDAQDEQRSADDESEASLDEMLSEQS